MGGNVMTLYTKAAGLDVDLYSSLMRIPPRQCSWRSVSHCTPSVVGAGQHTCCDRIAVHRIIHEVAL